MTGIVEHVHLAPESGAAVESRERVEAVAGRGLRGDRYFGAEGAFSQGSDDDTADRAVTLIEAEALDAVEDDYDIGLEPGEHRRNVTVRGVALNHLVGRRFRVGEAVCEGVELCEPCNYLERSLSKRGVEDALVHRGGLRARIVESGEIAVGDSVVSVASESD
ncbi:MOSC domain-containing protein [Halobium salinum]|uniref:MOSC domain-containing protein n=1 Tax=Halobium salinum TaxID=1364940 RepID=A0ABD5PFZ3_9EURY|nr:MOSC domain-containing protein [Halobium salinum]